MTKTKRTQVEKEKWEENKCINNSEKPKKNIPNEMTLIWLQWGNLKKERESLTAAQK